MSTKSSKKLKRKTKALTIEEVSLLVIACITVKDKYFDPY